MTKEDLIDAIKAADVGPFREVRLITLVHHKGVTAAVIDQVVSELKEVNDVETAEMNRLQNVLEKIEPDIQTLKELKKVVGKINKLAASAK